MSDKTYVALVAHEGIKVGQVVITEPTPRMESLLGAGYYLAVDALWPEPEKLVWEDSDESDDNDGELLERDEDQDVVEVVEVKKRRARRGE